MHKFWNPALALSLTHGIYDKSHSLLEPQFPHLSLGYEYSVSLVSLLAEAGGSSYPAPHWELSTGALLLNYSHPTSAPL